MKKLYKLPVVALFLMLLFKGNLLLVDTTLLYIATNVIGALLFSFYLYQQKSKFLNLSVLYILLNFTLYILDVRQTAVLPIASSLVLIVNVLVFVFPLLAISYYLKQFDTEIRSVKIGQNLMTFSLILTTIAAFVLLTGILFSYSLSFVSIAVVITQVLAVVALFISFGNIIRIPRSSQQLK